MKRRLPVLLLAGLAIRPLAARSAPSARARLEVDVRDQESRERRVALAILIHDLGLLPEQTRQILGHAELVERHLSDALASEERRQAREVYVATVDRVVDRILAREPVAPLPEELFQTRHRLGGSMMAHEDRVAESVEAIREVLSPPQSLTLARFDAHRVLDRIGFNGLGEESWRDQLVDYRELSDQQFEEEALPYIRDSLDEVGMAGRLEETLAMVREARRMTEADFVAKLPELTARLARLMTPDAGSASSADPGADEAPLDFQIQEYLLDPAIIPLLQRSTPEANPRTR